VAKEIVMPSVGMFTSEGTLSAWLRPAGARVEAGEPVAEVTTEKATQEITAPDAGIVHHVAELGTRLQIQQLIGYVLAPGEAPPALPLGSAPVVTSTPTATALAPNVVAPGAPSAPPLPAGEIRATPIARRLATEHKIDLARVIGTGPGGRIVEADILAAVAQRQAAPQAPAAPMGPRVRERIPLTGIRRTIADRLHRSKTVTAPVTLTREIDAEVLVAARGKLLDRVGGKLPYDALFVKVFATALRERPELNATIENDEIVVFDEVNVGFAVAVPGALLVPVITNADGRSLAEIVSAIGELSERARANRLRPDDVGGGTATITNLGGYGVDAFTPIINPPQSAILGIGRILARAVVRDGQLVARQTCVLSLTFDHRVADGVPAAQLLDRVAGLLNDEAFLDHLA
jgi:pyruvate/2-oxoglutarate dehydrogenase complex dihydrolipoamide acyltransferase (E2) component